MSQSCKCTFTVTCDSIVVARSIAKHLQKERLFCEKAKGNSVGFNLSPNRFVITKVVPTKKNFFHFIATTDVYLDQASVVKLGHMSKHITEVYVKYIQFDLAMYGNYNYNVATDEFVWRSLPNEFWPTDELNAIINDDTIERKDGRINNCLFDSLIKHKEKYDTTGQEILRLYEEKLAAISLTPQSKNTEDNDSIEDTKSSEHVCRCAESGEHEHCHCSHCTCNHTHNTEGN